MGDSAIDYANLTRICEFTRALHRVRQTGGDEEIDREFNAVCRAVWGYNLDDFTDDDLSPKDHACLDSLTRERPSDFAARHGYDLKDYVHGGWVSDWWGFTWMILAEARGLLTPENQAAAWRKYDEKLMAETNVVGVIRGRAPPQFEHSRADRKRTCPKRPCRDSETERFVKPRPGGEAGTRSRGGSQAAQTISWHTGCSQTGRSR
jgi:hypothetical protein